MTTSNMNSSVAVQNMWKVCTCGDHEIPGIQKPVAAELYIKNVLRFRPGSMTEGRRPASELQRKLPLLQYYVTRLVE
jgi:hypothetical protein